MQMLLDIGTGFFNGLWRVSWQASVLIVLVLTAQWVLRNHLSPRARHALWLLVLLRLSMPASFESSVSVFNVIPPIAAPQPVPMAQTEVPSESPVADEAEESDVGVEPATIAPIAPPVSSWNIALAVWAAGVMAVPLVLLGSNLRLSILARSQRPLTESRVLDLLEDCKEEMKVRTPLTLVETTAVTCPVLLGFVRPRLLLPAGFTDAFSLDELRHVFLHELGHIKRADIPLNWISTIPLMLHWFNPLVWFALHRMRADGEVACDALALRHAGEGGNRSYGATIIKLLESFSRPGVGPGMVGILEHKNQMRRRISMIAKFRNHTGWPVAATAAFAALTLVALTDAQSASRTSSEQANSDGPPKIVSTTPAVGATDVEPTLTEITVTFDRDMGAGFSWTGGGPDYPPMQPGKKAVWKDKRTCVLPVKLETGKFYRVGINSTGYQNFKSASGVPARPSAIYFTTKGASEALKSKVVVPQVVTIEPKNGAQDVDPGVKELRITFNVPMAAGFSWTGGGDHFPTIPEGKKPYWSEDKKTCVLPVELKSGWSYQLGLNSPSHKNFQSEGGVPLVPVLYTFKTRP